jgi:hypothetical protein
MRVKEYEISEFKLDVANPRIIDTYKYQTLLTSIRDFPEMMNVRPLVVDTEMNILCGNMRYRACRELGWEQVPAIMVDLPEDKRRELIIKDNISYGEWDDDAIEQDWDTDLFNKWIGKETFDYSALDYADLSGDMDAMSSGVKKAIQIEFGLRYIEAKELEKEARIRGIYIGGVFLEALKKIK